MAFTKICYSLIPEAVLQVMSASKPMRLVFVLPSPDASYFKIGPVLAPVRAPEAEVDGILKRLQFYALYVPVHTIASR